MQIYTVPRTAIPHLDESDEEALNLFEHLNPHPQSAPSDHQESCRPLGRLTKLKKEVKSEKRRQKKKQKKMRRLQKKMRQMEGGTIDIVTPLKKKKKSKRPVGSDGQEAMSHHAGSSEYSSGVDKQDLHNQLLNLNPDAAQEDDALGGSPRKRLKKSSRKMRIEEKEGFRVEQLGNQAQFVPSKLEREFDDEDYSFDDIGRKNCRKRKLKAKVPTNEQIMNTLKEQVGVVESDGEREGAAVSYDNGLDTLYAMKDKRKGAIKVNNKFFCDLDMDAQGEEAQMQPPQNLELQLKPKTSTLSASRFTFLSKVEELKKQRGLENNVNLQEYQRNQQQRNKKSMAQMVTSIVSQDLHDDIDLEVRVPTIARGKSAEIINNTVFLRSFSTKNEASVQAQSTQAAPLRKEKKENFSRHEFYRRINIETRTRKSMSISEEQLKGSFKKSTLGELEETRKRNQEKRRKEALSEQSEEGESESKMDQLLEEQESICGDRQGEQQQQEKEEGEGMQEQKLNEVQIIINLKEGEGDERQCVQQEKQQEKDVQQLHEQVINEQDQLIQQLASSSHPQTPHQQQENAQQSQQAIQGEEEQQDDQEGEDENQEHSSAIVQEKMIQAAPEVRQQQMELQKEGIMLRKRKIADNKPNQQQIKQSNMEDEQSIVKASQTPQQDKENAVNLPNTLQSHQQKQATSMQQQSEETHFRDFKKLRKIAMVIAEKRRVRQQGRRYAAEFIEQQAEQGSDNEQHDQVVKKIDFDKENQEYEGQDLDEELAQLIDNAVDINEEDEQLAFRKYLEDIRIKDREEIRKIIRGEFKTRQIQEDFDVDEDEKRRQQRMEEAINWMKKREEEQGNGMYVKASSQEENSDFDSDSEYREKRRKKKEQQKEDEADRIPDEQEKAMIERFIENTLPLPKHTSVHAKTIDLGMLPPSVQMNSRNLNKKIGISLLGGKSGDPVQMKNKKVSSLANEVFSRNKAARFGQKRLISTKVGKK